MDWVARAANWQLAQKFTLVHAIFEGFAAINEDHGNFIAVLATQGVVGVHVHLTPGKATPFLQLRQTLLHDFAKMAAFPGVHHDLAARVHAAQCSKEGAIAKEGYTLLSSFARRGLWGARR